MSAMFWYLIDNCHTCEGLIVNIGGILVISKGEILDSKFWVRSKILAVGRDSFLALSLSTR